MISATLIDVDTYQVEIESAPGATYVVTMGREDYLALSGGTFTQEWVIIQAFRFLLEREPASAILRRFDIRDIASYFPEFDDEMKARLERR